MGKKIKILLSTAIIFTLTLLTFKSYNVLAIDNLDLETSNNLLKFESYLNSVSNNDNNMAQYYKDLEMVIKNYYPNFNISHMEFTSRVTGTNSYKILEVTPDSYTGEAINASDLIGTVNSIKNIFTNKTKTTNFSDRYVFTNMQNFEVTLMTMKELAANRDVLSGVYDAIVFTSSDNYNPGKQASCAFNVDLKQLEFKRIYDGNNKLRYEGYFLGGNYHGQGKVYDQNSRLRYDGQFNNGQYHGQGSVYDQNGRLTYSGGYINGQRSCYGKYYDQNGRLRYEGKWLNDKRHGYGTSYDQNGRFEFEGYWENDIKQENQSSIEFLNDITILKAKEIIDNFVKKGLPVFIHDDVYNYQNNNFNQLFKDLITTYPHNIFKIQNKTFSVLETVAIMGITEVLSIKPHLKITEKPIDYYIDSKKQYKSGDLLNFKFELTNKNEATVVFYVDINQNNVLEKYEVADAKALVKGNNQFSYQIPANVMSGLLKYRLEVIADGLVTRYDGTIRIKGAHKTINVVNIVSEMVYNKSNLLDPTLVQKYFQNNGDYTINIKSCNIKDIGNNGSKNECSHSEIFDPNNKNVDVVLLGQDIFDKNLNTPTYNSIKNYVVSGKPIIFTSSITKGKDKWQDYFSEDLFLADYRTDSYKINNANRLQIMNVNSFNAYPNNIVGQELIIPEDLNYAFNENFQLDLEEIDLVPLLNMYKNNPYNLDRFDAYNNFYYMQARNVVYLNVGNNSYQVYKDIEHKLLANAISNLYILTNAKQAELKDYYSISLNNNYNNALINLNDAVDFDFTFISNVDEDNYNYKVKANSTLVKEGQLTKNISQSVNLINLANPMVNKVDEVYISIEITNNEGRKVFDYGFRVYVANLQNYFKVTQNLNMTNTKINDENGIKQIGINNVYNLEYLIEYLTIDLTSFNNNNLPSKLILKNLEFKDILPANIEPNLDNSYNVVKNEHNESVITKTFNDLTLNYQNGKYVPTRVSEKITIPFKATRAGTYAINQGTISVNGIGHDFDIINLGNLSFNAIKVLNETLVEYKLNADYLFIPYKKGTSNSLYIPDYIKVDKDVKVTSVSYQLEDNLGRFSYNDDSKTLAVNEMGKAKMTVEVTDIFGKKVTKTFAVISYEPITSLEINDLILNLNQQPTLILNNQIPLLEGSLSYSIRNINTNDEIVEIFYDNGLYYIKPLKVGSAEITFTGYDHQGFLITKSAVIIVKEPSAIEFTQNNISLFIGGNFDIRDIIKLDILSSYGFEFNNITWTSSNPSIVSISDGIINAKNKTGYAVVTGTVSNEHKVYTAQVLVKVSDYISQDSGFDKLKLQNYNLYDGTIYNLDSFLKEKLSGVDYSYFEPEIIQGSGRVIALGDNNYEFIIDEFETIIVKLTVKMTQVIPGKDQPIEVIDTVFIMINGGYGNF